MSEKREGELERNVANSYLGGVYSTLMDSNNTFKGHRISRLCRCQGTLIHEQLSKSNFFLDASLDFQ